MNKIVSPQLVLVFAAATVGLFFLFDSGLRRAAKRYRVNLSEGFIIALAVMGALLGGALVSILAIFAGAVPIGC
jgi:hypothetical protein